MPKKDVLSFEEIHRLVKITAKMGVDRIRLTGGEPLVRSELWKLISLIKSVEGIVDVGLTTNGLLLGDQAQNLRDAGLDRLNVSLDTIDPEVFEKITRRKGLEKVLEGIQAAKRAGFTNIRINAVSIKGLTESEIVPLAQFSRDNDLELRFIEFMPLDADEAWNLDQVLTGSQVRETISNHVGNLIAVHRDNLSQPAVDYEYENISNNDSAKSSAKISAKSSARVGFINSVSEPFCDACNRMRVTAEGKIRNCLFSSVEWDVREGLRSGATDQQIENIIRECVMAKKAGHGSDSGRFLRPEKAMYQIGG